jgi:hypothetical protein
MITNTERFKTYCTIASDIDPLVATQRNSLAAPFVPRRNNLPRDEVRNIMPRHRLALLVPLAIDDSVCSRLRSIREPSRADEEDIR